MRVEEYVKEKEGRKELTLQSFQLWDSFSLILRFLRSFKLNILLVERMEGKVIITNCMSVKHSDREANCVINYFRVHLSLPCTIHDHDQIAIQQKIIQHPKVSVFVIDSKTEMKKCKINELKLFLLLNQRSYEFVPFQNVSSSLSSSHVICEMHPNS